MSDPHKTLLVPIDFEPPSLEALAFARDLAGRLGLEIILLHVYSVPALVYPGWDPTLVAPGLADQIAEFARSAIEQLAASAGNVRTMTRGGTPVTEILRAIDETRPMMTVMGTHGRTGLSHLLLGSVAERIVQLSPTPVLTVRTKSP